MWGLRLCYGCIPRVESAAEAARLFAKKGWAPEGAGSWAALEDFARRWASEQRGAAA
jgi:2-keto-3-deoxy-L-rhamnonate aldolase RhmA